MSPSGYRLGADVPPDDVVVGMTCRPLLIDDVDDRPAVRALGADAGVEAEERTAVPRQQNDDVHMAGGLSPSRPAVRMKITDDGVVLRPTRSIVEMAEQVGIGANDRRP